MTDIRFEFHEFVVDGDRVAARVTMHARQHGPFVVYDSPDGRVTDVFPATGRQCAVQQTHWLRIADGLIVEHDAGVTTSAWPNSSDGFPRRRPSSLGNANVVPSV